MRIFLTGASGFIGGHILRTLSARGHAVTALVRGTGAARIRDLALPGVEVFEGEFTRPADWSTRVAGHDAVVNAVGIIRQTPRATFQAVHADAPIALFEAAAAGGVGRIVQISALGADDAATTQYHLTKRAADRRLAGLGVPYVVLRPSVVYGPGDHSMAFFASLAALPVTAVPGDGNYRLHPLHVEDLVRAVVLSLERPPPAGLTVDVGGGRPVTFRGLLDTLARRMGRRGCRVVGVPWSVMRAVATFTDALGAGPISGDELSMLRRENFADNTAFVNAFGFEPVGLEAGLARRGLGPDEARAALLQHVRVPLRLSVAFIWLATGIICTAVPAAREEGFRILEERLGLTSPLADLAVYGTCGLEIVLGLATAAGIAVRLCGAVQLGLIAAFTAIATATVPELWWHPAGPLTKNIPIIGATLAMMAMED
jgi:nucleoside-diphosphate-sugar epimerase/uncharacterized membrane protein YphA (DoxX/SURF4 family)